MVEPHQDAIFAFESERAFEAWIEKNHQRATEIYIRVYKKGSDIASITTAQALDVALCWGWIDAIRKSYDEVSFLQRYTPRKSKSTWSQINRDKVARLIAEKRMTAHGLKQVEAAKADGRWGAAYAPASKMETPDDLRRAIEKNPRASAAFKTLSKQNLFAMAFRLGNLKTAVARERRIAAYVEMLARGETLHPSRKQT